MGGDLKLGSLGIHFPGPNNEFTMLNASPMWRNGRRNGLKIRWAITGPCRFESGHRQSIEEYEPLNN